MARGIIRKPSFNKIVGAYRSQWKRFWRRLFSFGAYGSRGIGWLKDPKKAWYNFWYYRTSVSVYDLLGCRPSRGSCFFAMIVASAASIFVAPVDATREGVRAHKVKKARKARAEGEARQKSSSREESSSGVARNSSAASTHSPSRTAYTESARIAANSRARVASKTVSNRHKPAASVSLTVTVEKPEEKREMAHGYSVPSLFPKNEKPRRVAAVSETPAVPDENTPKSKPKQECDQYIRKRMIIAGSSYCDRAVLDSLSVGAYFDVEAEPDNPYDKNAVRLSYNGNRIGYIAKQDYLAFVTSLRLNRKIYGVITDIKDDGNSKKYEFETWFDNKK